LESIIWNVFHNHPSAITSLSEGVIYFFNNAKPYLENPMYEVTGFGKLIDTYLTPEDRQLSNSALDYAKSKLQFGSLISPISNWKYVFGDKILN
jgi:hypothetical protein